MFFHSFHRYDVGGEGPRGHDHWPNAEGDGRGRAAEVNGVFRYGGCSLLGPDIQ